MVEEAENRYRVALQQAREELVSHHARERESLMFQVRQLEDRLGRVLKEREIDKEREKKGRCGQYGCGRSSEETDARVQQVLEQWRANMTHSVKMLVRTWWVWSWACGCAHIL